MYSIIGICFEKIDRFLISARCPNSFQSTNKRQKTLQHFVKIDISLLIKHFFKLCLYFIDGQYIAKNENEKDVKKGKGTQKFK